MYEVKSSAMYITLIQAPSGLLQVIMVDEVLLSFDQPTQNSFSQNYAVLSALVNIKHRQDNGLIVIKNYLSKFTYQHKTSQASLKN